MLELLDYPLLSYTLIALILVMSPGADVLLVLGSALRGGVKAGILTATGISIGSFIWALLVAVGLVTLLRASPILLNVITFAGVLYMLYVGYGEIKAGMSKEASSFEVKGDEQIDNLQYIRKGLIVNLLNPKVGVFYLSFLPQFVPNGELTVKSVLTLGGVHIILGIIWLSACSFGIDKAQSLINNDRFNKTLMIVAGILIIGFALIILWSRISQLT